MEIKVIPGSVGVVDVRVLLDTKMRKSIAIITDRKWLRNETVSRIVSHDNYDDLIIGDISSDDDSLDTIVRFHVGYPDHHVEKIIADDQITVNFYKFV